MQQLKDERVMDRQSHQVDNYRKTIAISTNKFICSGSSNLRHDVFNQRMTNTPSRTAQSKLRVAAVFIVLILFVPAIRVQAQDISLSLKEALDHGIRNHQRIQAKRNYYQASHSLLKNARNEYLPNVIASVQQNYGTVNGQFGPLAAVGVLGVSSAGPSYSSESWNAAFGALYILNANWEVFTFGRVRSRIQLADAQARQDSADILQEEFVHRVKITGAYLNLLVAQRFVRTAEANLQRAEIIRTTVRARVLSGLNAGVDSSQANSEASRARLNLLDMQNNVLKGSQDLATLLNVSTTTFQLDTVFLDKIPTLFNTESDLKENPQMKFYEARMAQAKQAERVARRSLNPALTLFGIYQARASGFQYNYTPEFPDRYSSRYSDGVDPSRYNYVAGFSISWNLLSPFRVRQQALSQRFVGEAYRYEYDEVEVQLKNQLIASDQQIQNSLRSAEEAPVQLKAASDAYLQKSVLYRNGLTNMADLQLAMYALNRAELDRSVSYINVWQALLLKAAASGDFELFINQAE